MGFDDPTIVAGAESMLRTGCNFNDTALAALAVYNHPLMTPAESATWREVVGNGLRAGTAAQDQAFRQHLRACGESLIAAHPDIEPEIRTAWLAFAVDRDGPPGTTATSRTDAIGPFPASNSLPPVVDLVAVMTESWHRLRRMIEQDPDWYNRACIHPPGRA